MRISRTVQAAHSKNNYPEGPAERREKIHVSLSEAEPDAQPDPGPEKRCIKGGGKINVSKFLRNILLFNHD